MNYWKLGCGKWGTDASANFYDLLLDNGLVICGDNPMEQGDIVAIAYGHQIVALAQITGARVPLMEHPELHEEFEKYEITPEDWISIAPARILPLRPEEQFQYEIRQGICQIHKPEIIDKIAVCLKKRI